MANDTHRKSLPLDRDPSDYSIEEKQRILHQGVVDAARLYKMHGIQMVVGDKDGNIREIDPQTVIDKAEADERERAKAAG
ncbi:MAG: hypothetical protein AAGK78_03910 [Planctomycetota bacterium]